MNFGHFCVLAMGVVVFAGARNDTVLLILMMILGLCIWGLLIKGKIP
ncbi:hypothetical protein [Deinococcus cellulosilyticus]|uniref:Uncharacterized protein n=1 Tax=Deinococcus cellulosilyticus (strain DSM 18568 / NBRC 106333 / KACC 11606 / 5516J-15) TaxID=1223518 RepID=A0A511N2Y9_DEIC1|nr:hypothetical protein [Deinococcus cellulosilyticus]GEM47225.1 hypothetical protein DC3_28600 [Deinococcus cellulosilyticus NBRC 106333 = KACC 11606]